MSRPRKVEQYNIQEYVNHLLSKGISYKGVADLVKLKYQVDISHESIFRWAHYINDKEDEMEPDISGN